MEPKSVVDVGWHWRINDRLVPSSALNWASDQPNDFPSTNVEDSEEDNAYMDSSGELWDWPHTAEIAHALCLSYGRHLTGWHNTTVTILCFALPNDTPNEPIYFEFCHFCLTHALTLC